MMYLKTRYITLNDLKQLGIADKHGLIDYQEFNKLKLENKDKGVNLKMGTNNIFERGINFIDKSPIYYNGKRYDNKIDIIEWNSQ